MIDFITKAPSTREQQLREARTANEVAAVLYPNVAKYFTAFIECEAGMNEFPYLDLMDLNDEFWAHSLGYVGTGMNPIVYVTDESQFRRYNSETGIYERSPSQPLQEN